MNVRECHETIDDPESTSAQRDQAQRTLVQLHDEQPVTDSVIMRCISAWRDCGTARQIAIGMSGGVVGDVPWPAVHTWCQHHGLDYDITNMIWSVIHQLDADRVERDNRRRMLESFSQGARR